MHPVPLHPLQQPQGRHGHLVVLFAKLQQVGKAWDVQAGVCGRHAPQRGPEETHPSAPQLGPLSPVCHTSSQGPLFPDMSPRDRQPQEQLRTLQLAGRTGVPCRVRWGQACVLAAQAPAEAHRPVGCFVGILRISREAEQILTHSFSAFTLVEQQLRPSAFLSVSVCAHLLSERLPLAEGGQPGWVGWEPPVRAPSLCLPAPSPRCSGLQASQNGQNQLSNQPG